MHPEPFADECGLADLHIHSFFSDGSAYVPEILEYVEERTNLNIIAITDHDKIEGALLARELVEKGKYSFEVVMGMEVSTLEGHLLVLFVENPVPSHQSLLSTITAVHAQGGLCIVPHPLSSQRDSISRHSIEKVLKKETEEVYLDGIEIINPVAASLLCGLDVRQLNDQHFHLAEVGGSDSHSLAMVGVRCTEFSGHTAGALYRQIKNKTTMATGSGNRLP